MNCQIQFSLEKNPICRLLNILPRVLSVKNQAQWYLLEPPRRGGSNGYPQSMFLSRSKKNNVYPCKPQLYYIKVGFKGANIFRRVFMMRL